MFPVNRRMLLLGTGALAVAITDTAGQACTVTASVKPIAFSDMACRRSLRELINLVSRASTLSDGELTTRINELSINLDGDVIDAIFEYKNRDSKENFEVVRAWSVAAGRRDRSPLSLREVNLLKGERGVALYQFTLRRDQYHPELTEDDAGGSCSGPYPAFYGPEDTSYLGVFINNRLRDISTFDQWLRKL